MRFLNKVTVPKNVKGGNLWDFLTSIVLQNIFKKLKGRPFGGIQKASKKSHNAEKKIRVKKRGGGSYVIDVLYVDVFVVDEVVSSVLWTSVVQVDDVEQMNKKVHRSR